jgi:DNA polymerase IV
VLGADTLPGRLLDLDLIALPGIGSNMRRRLNAAGIHSVSDFWTLTPGRARKVWGGIGGEGFWYALHGLDPPEIETKRGSIGHSHVLAPELRAPGSALGVARRLMAKTASRLRRMGYRAGLLTLSIRLERGGNLAGEQRFPATSDSFALLRALENAARDLLPLLGSQFVRKIGVTLSALAPVSEEQPDLFGWTPANDEHAERLKLSDALDRLNARYGRDTVSIGAAARLPRYTGTKVAFNRIPDRAEFRE